MSNKRYINQIQFNPANSNNVINSVSNFLHQNNFQPINVNGETFFANSTIDQFNWLLCLKISFNGNVAFIEAWLVGVDVFGNIKFKEEYGVDSMYGSMWRPITILKAIIRDVESIIMKEA